MNILYSRRSIVTADESVAIDRRQNRDQHICMAADRINNQQSVIYGICFGYHLVAAIFVGPPIRWLHVCWQVLALWL